MAHTNTVIHLRDHSYRWIDINHVPRDGVPGDAPEDVLRSLLGHRAYGDSYMFPESETDLPIHGPYNPDMLSVASFAKVTPAQAGEAFDDWFFQCGPVAPEQVEGDLEAAAEDA